MIECAALKLNGGEQAQEERKHQILQNFNKALWNVLKQHRDKLKVMFEECVFYVKFFSHIHVVP